ncbi:insulinase family protein [Rhodobacteraceae bacterium N5(2021)]|uniref:Insulinase family protein n=1 Tax=Gymnodinialimonas phycosphaerae TaxID=2841589 RepID=A0A975TSR9_9RHOB|nr:pitrilysin family protein [Gymnodinialimonas phycosphaerae]MBY4893964.1 insulinase family protein [Gymnodinialimonas phycosphaerae]
MIARFFTPLVAAPFLAIMALAAPVHANIIDIQPVTSQGGIDAWLVEDTSIPFVAMDFWFEGGGSIDAADARGAVHLMAALLEEGAGDLDATTFAERLEGLAASFSFDVYRDELVISVQMLSQNRDEVLALLRDVLMAPRFDADAVERVRGQVLSILEGDANDPDTIAGAAFNALTFGDHPYASRLEGTLDSVAALTRDDLLAAHRSAIVRDRVSVGVAGDMTAEDLGPILDTLLGDLPDSDVPLLGMAEVSDEGGITVIDFATPQSSVYFGHAGIARDDPDFFAAFVANQILGAGGYRSRLMEEVREQRGLTYGISTWLSLSKSAPMMQGGFSSSNGLVAEAIAVVQAEWADMAENGVTEAELEAAQRYMTGSYPLRFDGNGTIAGILAAMQADNMAIDYIATRNDNVLAVTVEDVQRVAAELIDSDALRFVVVGQPEGLEPSN